MREKMRNVLRSVIFMSLCFIMSVLMMAKADAAETRFYLNNTWVSGSITTKGGVDFYRIVLPKAGFVHIDYQGWSIADSYVEVWNGDLTERFSRQNVCISSNDSPKTYSADYVMEAGTYYVKVFPYGNNTGTYRLRGTFTAAGNTENEPNNSFASAGNLSANTKVMGLLSLTDRLDFYRIVVPSVQKVKIVYSGRIADSYYSIWNSDYECVYRKNVYTGSEASPKTSSYEVTLNAGVYYIKIEPYGSNCGRYQLSWYGAGNVKVSGISISGNKTDIAGRSFLLKATVTPDNATNKGVKWTSSNTSVAVVNEGGKVTTQRPGKAIITAAAVDGSGVKSSVKVIATPQQMSGLKLKNTGYGELCVMWYRQVGVTGYEFQYSKSSSFTGARKYQFKNTVRQLNLSNLSKGRYYVRVRSYVVIDSVTYYGPWSMVKYCQVVA